MLLLCCILTTHHGPWQIEGAQYIVERISLCSNNYPCSWQGQPSPSIRKASSISPPPSPDSHSATPPPLQALSWPFHPTPSSR